MMRTCPLEFGFRRRRPCSAEAPGSVNVLCTGARFSVELGRLPQAVRRSKRSAHLMRPVICITTNSVRIEPTVMARPVKPLKKKA